jgi:hypothetical protein
MFVFYDNNNGQEAVERKCLLVCASCLAQKVQIIKIIITPAMATAEGRREAQMEAIRRRRDEEREARMEAIKKRQEEKRAAVERQLALRQERARKAEMAAAAKADRAQERMEDRRRMREENRATTPAQEGE